MAGYKLSQEDRNVEEAVAGFSRLLTPHSWGHQISSLLYKQRLWQTIFHRPAAGSARSDLVASDPTLISTHVLDIVPRCISIALGTILYRNKLVRELGINITSVIGIPNSENGGLFFKIISMNTKVSEPSH